MATLYEQLGGEPVLRRVISTFIDEDRMIGFFFRAADRQRIKEMEFQWTACLLGAAIEYEGRPLKEAHSRHPIMGGQFQRRQQILRDVLEEHRVPEEIQRVWLSHNETLRPLITRDAGSECNTVPAQKKSEVR
jgi:hemoglobin